MSALAPSRKGWCPGALRPMPAGDGLLVRVRPFAGRLGLIQAGALAIGAERFGNGVIEVTSRANVQVRGVAVAALPGLQALLDDVGLLEGDEDAEAACNVVVSPLSDLDPQAAFDVGPVAAALWERLAGDARLADLPAKFGFAVDAGGMFAIPDVPADVRFAALPGAGFTVTLAGDETCAAACSAGGVPDFAAKLAFAFLDCAPLPRMRDLVAEVGAASVFARAGLAGPLLPCGAELGGGGRRLGAFALGGVKCLALAPPLGRMQANAFGALVEAAKAQGARDLRLTPWRTLVVVGARATLQGAAAGLGFIAAAADPRLGVVACAGAPACLHAARDVQADALALAPHLPRGRGVRLHVSGCEKGCARAAPAALTLVARSSGYDLIVDGGAKSAPAGKNLGVADVVAYLARLPRETAPP